MAIKLWSDASMNFDGGTRGFVLPQADLTQQRRTTIHPRGGGLGVNA